MAIEVAHVHPFGWCDTRVLFWQAAEALPCIITNRHKKQLNIDPIFDR